MSMTISILNFLKKVKDQAFAAKEQSGPPKTPVCPADKPSSERFSKTVMPNTTRTLTPQDPFEVASRSLGGGAAGGSTSPGIPGPRTIAFGPTPAPTRPADFPPAVALALEPMVERVVALTLGDVAPHIPSDYIKPIESIDASRRILLKACEMEKGMATRKPSISLATVYEQVPEIFLRSVAPADCTQIQLPFEKVLEQLTSLQVRSDQDRHQAVPQVETPFLKVTLEDNSRFGTTTEVFEISDLPPMRIQPPTAEAFAAAEPETAGSGFVDAETKSTTPTRVSLEISPNGTGGPAPESVPASSGPSVPTSLHSPTPTRIPFKISSSNAESQDKQEASQAAEKSVPVELPAAPLQTPTGPNITIALQPILKCIPPSQLSGDAGSIAAGAKIELPLSLIEPQLAAGRIALSPGVLMAAMATEDRNLVKIGDGPDVVLPLQEVLKSLPMTALRIRQDQETPEVGEDIATPFSAKAEEDAKRFGGAVSTGSGTPSVTVAAGGEVEAAKRSVPVAKEPVAKEPVAAAEAAASVATEPAPTVKEQSPIAKDSAPADKEPKDTKESKESKETKETKGGKGSSKSKKQAQAAKGAAAPVPAPFSFQPVVEQETKIDDKELVARVSNLPGVKACSLIFSDGLSLAGSLPTEYAADGLCAMAPSLMRRIETHLVETKLGPLRNMTVSCSKGALTFFTEENVCLAALHETVDLKPEVQEELAKAVHELSQKYSQPV